MRCERKESIDSHKKVPVKVSQKGKGGGGQLMPAQGERHSDPSESRNASCRSEKGEKKERRNFEKETAETLLMGGGGKDKTLAGENSIHQVRKRYLPRKFVSSKKGEFF